MDMEVIFLIAPFKFVFSQSSLKPARHRSEIGLRRLDSNKRITANSLGWAIEM